MTTQPTAAPWKVTIEPTHIPGIIRASIEAADGPYRGSIAYLQNVDWDGGIGPDEMIANAHLLGAAPDMFAALEMAKDALRHHDPEQPYSKAIRAALAKARGKA